MALDLTIYENFILEKYLSLFNNDLLNHITEQEARYIIRILQREEEANCNHKDVFGNFEFGFTSENYLEPYLDRFIISLLKKYNLTKKNLWGEHPFAFILSHDVDLVNKNCYKQDLRAAIKHLFHNKGLGKLNFFLYFALMFRNILFRLRKGSDTLWDYHIWVDLEKSFNFFSTYFIFIRPEFSNLHYYDCDFKAEDHFRYRGNKVKLKQYLEDLEVNNCEIGLHGSYFAAKNADLVQNQYNKLQKLVKQKICVYRNHYLHFDINETPKALDNSPIAVDSTIGFNRAIGFRAGTCFPFYLKNEEMQGQILEVSQLIMDSSLFLSNSLELNLELAKTKVKDILDKVEEVGGIFTVNFHPDKISRPYFIEIYNYILEECKLRNGKCVSYNNLNFPN